MITNYYAQQPRKLSRLIKLAIEMVIILLKPVIIS